MQIIGYHVVQGPEHIPDTSSNAKRLSSLTKEWLVRPPMAGEVEDPSEGPCLKVHAKKNLRAAETHFPICSARVISQPLQELSDLKLCFHSRVKNLRGLRGLRGLQPYERPCHPNAGSIQDTSTPQWQ